MYVYYRLSIKILGIYPFTIDLRSESEFTYGCMSHPDLGLDSGCCDLSVSISCKAKSTNSSDSSTCYCDDLCYFANDCCDDILEIGCVGEPYSKHCSFIHITCTVVRKVLLIKNFCTHQALQKLNTKYFQHM